MSAPPRSGKREPRMPTFSSAGTWKTKVDSGLVEQMHQLSSLSTGNMSQEEGRKWLRKVVDSAVRGSGTVPGTRTRAIGYKADHRLFYMGFWTLRWLCFMKYQKLPEELLQETRAGGPAGLEAFDRLKSAERTHYMLVFGMLDSDGKRDGIRKLRFKTNKLHATLMLTGLSHKRGVGSLDEGELGDFFDEVCYCGQTPHSPEALRRLRDRVRRKLVQWRAAGYYV